MRYYFNYRDRGGKRGDSHLCYGFEIIVDFINGSHEKIPHPHPPPKLTPKQTKQISYYVWIAMLNKNKK